jgi:hypothetical protein
MEVAVRAGAEGDRAVRVRLAVLRHQLAQQARPQIVLEAVADDEGETEPEPDRGVAQLLQRLAPDGEDHAASAEQKQAQ